jgi:hypothetical protein
MSSLTDFVHLITVLAPKSSTYSHMINMCYVNEWMNK